MRQRFQKEVELCYSPGQEVDLSLLRYYHHLTEQHYRAILLASHTISESSFKKVNPYGRREENFEVNRLHRDRIDFSQFISMCDEDE